ncbi:MAG: T9SS type A sorting domain-containing protein [FCB group bacterium]|jgi:photosystem II stability/assembly factor-like uncharacterized protein
MKIRSLILAIGLAFVAVIPVVAADFWEKVNIPNDMPVTDIIKAPNGDLYACNIGIYRSTDNGVSWFVVNRFVYQGDTINFDEYGANINLLTSTHNGFIFATLQNGFTVRTTDNGQNWSVILQFRALSIAIDKNDKIFIDTGDTVFYSNNYGKSWAGFGFDNNYGVGGLKFDDEGNLFKCSHYCWYSLAQGDSVFRKINSNNFPYDAYINYIGIKDSLIFAGSSNGIYISSDKGLNWDINKKLNGTYITNIITDSSGNIYACSWDNGIYISKDNGITWDIYNKRFNRKTVNKILIDNNDIFVAGMELNYSSDKGTTWTLRNNITDHPFASMLGKDTINYYILTPNNLYYSDNNFKTWNIIESDVVNLSTINSWVIDNTGKFHILAQTGYFTSTDKGKTWHKDTTFSNPMNLKKLKNGDMLISDFNSMNYNIYISKDNGSTWNEFTPYWGLQNIFVGKSFEFIIISKFSLSLNSIFHADIYNYDETILGSSQLPTVLDNYETIYGFLTDSNNYYFIGYMSGFWSSKDNGKNWENKNNGLPDNQPYKKISHMVMVNDKIYVATPKGIFMTTDYGDNWVDFNTGMTPALAYTVEYLDDGHLYATTTMGLFRSKDVINKIEDNYIVPITETFSISPNPASAQLKIQFNEIYREPVSISIFNSLGVEVYSKIYDDVSNNAININTREMPPGTYFCRVVSGKKAETRKFVVIR